MQKIKQKYTGHHGGNLHENRVNGSNNNSTHRRKEFWPKMVAVLGEMSVIYSLDRVWNAFTAKEMTNMVVSFAGLSL